MPTRFPSFQSLVLWPSISAFILCTITAAFTLLRPCHSTQTCDRRNVEHLHKLRTHIQRSCVGIERALDATEQHGYMCVRMHAKQRWNGRDNFIYTSCDLEIMYLCLDYGRSTPSIFLPNVVSLVANLDPLGFRKQK